MAFRFKSPESGRILKQLFVNSYELQQNRCAALSNGICSNSISSLELPTFNRLQMSHYCQDNKKE